MPDADPHPAVAAILAVTATDSDGLVVTEYYEDGGPHISQPAEVVAREQAIALLRWCAGMFDPSPGGWPNSLADEIERSADA